MSPCLISILIASPLRKRAVELSRVISDLQIFAAKPVCFLPAYHYNEPATVAHRSILCGPEAIRPVAAARVPALPASQAESRRPGRRASHSRAESRPADQSHPL